MTRKNIFLCIILFVVTFLASTYFYMEQPLRKIASTTYTLYPLFALRIVFPLLWGLSLFLLAWSQKSGATNNHIVRIIIEAIFLIANILSVFVNFNKFFDFSSYNIILIGLLTGCIMFETVQHLAAKESPSSPS